MVEQDLLMTLLPVARVFLQAEEKTFTILLKADWYVARREMRVATLYGGGVPVLRIPPILPIFCGLCWVVWVESNGWIVPFPYFSKLVPSKDTP